MFFSLFSRAYANAPLLLCIAAFCWASNAVAARYLVGEITPMMLVFLRWALAVAFILPFYSRQMIKAWPIMKTHLRWSLLMGGIGLSAFNALLYIAAHRTTAVNLGIIQAVMPGMILLGSFFLFGARINLVQIVGLLLTLVGIGVIVTQGSLEKLILMTFNNGDLLMLLACLLYSCYAIGLKERPHISGMVMMCYLAIAAFIVSIPLVIIENIVWGTIMPNWQSWLIVIYIAIMPSFLSQAFFMRGVDLIGPGSAGLYTNLIPIFAAIMAIALLDEAFKSYHLIAVILVFGGIGLFEFQNRKKAKNLKN
jgi:drug/metabolite transporter (DMT)-like permease